MSLMYIVIWVYGVSPTCRLHRPLVESPIEWASFPQADGANAVNLWLSMSNYHEHQTLTKSPCEIIHNCFIDTGEKVNSCGDCKFMQTEKKTIAKPLQKTFANVSRLQVAFCYSVTCIHTFNLWMVKLFMFY